MVITHQNGPIPELATKSQHSRIAFLVVDQVRNFEVQGEVGLVVRDVAGMTCQQKESALALPSYRL